MKSEIPSYSLKLKKRTALAHRLGHSASSLISPVGIVMPAEPYRVRKDAAISSSFR
jgi:hypothetical protein